VLIVPENKFMSSIKTKIKLLKLPLLMLVHKTTSISWKPKVVFEISKISLLRQMKN